MFKSLQASSASVDTNHWSDSIGSMTSPLLQCCSNRLTHHMTHEASKHFQTKIKHFCMARLYYVILRSMPLRERHTLHVVLAIDISAFFGAEQLGVSGPRLSMSGQLPQGPPKALCDLQQFTRLMPSATHG